MKINLDTWNDTRINSAACNWVEIEAGDISFQYGSHHSVYIYHWSVTPAHISHKVIFQRADASPPQVLVC